MLNALLALSVYCFLFVLLLFSVHIGEVVGKRYRLKHPDQKQVIVKVAEGTVFALLGLLIAFTFSGAYERFESRKMRIIDEINAIETAYLRINLLAPETQAPLRSSFLDYIQARINIYQKMSDIRNVDKEIAESIKVRDKIWQQALDACKITGQQPTTLLFIPAINNMFEIATSRFAIRYIHPPLGIFALLIILASLASFLTGYSMGSSNYSNPIYAISFVAITALTLYVIIDLEFPRMGLIRVDTFDHMLVVLKRNLH